MIQFIVNGQSVSYEPVENDDLCLLDYIRDTLHLTGTKRGCEEKVCGACTVLIDGQATRACHVLVKDMDGKVIETIEHQGTPENLSVLQAAFIEYNAVQCGFCTPGIIMAAKGLLDANTDPTDEEINRALRLNLCRCGTYPRVIQAVKKAAAVLRGESVPPYEPTDISKAGSSIGKSVARIDLPDKVTGRTKFYADYQFENPLYGKIVFPPFPHARILNIDTSEALKVPEVELVLTAKDVPGSNRFGVLTKDQQVFVDRHVKYIGEIVAVVFANTPEAAEAGVAKVHVDYEQLPGIFSVEDALKEDAPLIPDPELESHPMGYIKGEKGNIMKEVHIYRGDYQQALADSEVVVEEHFQVPPEEHAWIEIDGTVSNMDENGNICVYAPNQSPFADRAQLAEILGLPVEKVRIIHTPAGGAFGGKTELTTHAHAAIATMKTGRPARMVLTRKESLRTHPKRHGMQMHYVIGADRDGKVNAMDVNLVSDAGAYGSWTYRVLEQGISYCTGPYYVPNFDLKALGVYTNNMIMGAMRGFGAIQPHFAAETAMDMLARKLEMDPIRLREINGLRPGLPMTTGQYVDETLGIDYMNTLSGARQLIEEKIMPRLKAGRAEGRAMGIGVASGWRSVAGGLGPAENAGAAFVLKADGRVGYYIACTEMGQGSNTSLSQIAEEVTGVSMEDFDLIAGDTDIVPYGGGVMASRGVFLWGHATISAGKDFRKKLLELAAHHSGLPVEQLGFSASQFTHNKTGEIVYTLKDLAALHGEEVRVEVDHYLPKSYPVLPNTNEDETVDPKDYNVHHTVAYNTLVTLVEVDKKTGNVDVLYMGAVCDGGQIINPDAAATQIEGAYIMGTAYGLTSDFKIKDGLNLTDTLGKTKIPRINQIPREIEVIFTPAHDPTGPFGAKGIAEMCILTPAPAICNAIYDAVGVRITSLPVNDHKAVLKEAAQNV